MVHACSAMKVTEDDIHIIHGTRPAQPLVEASLGRLVYDSLKRNPNTRPALIDAATEESISFRKLLQLSCSLAASLKRHGYGKDTFVSICSENNLQFFLPIFSSFYIGAIVAPINHNYTDPETLHCLNICKPRIVFCSKAVSQKFVRLRDTQSYIERVIVIDSHEAAAGTETLEGFIYHGLQGSELVDRFEVEEVDPERQVALVMCSSGTTGLPKGVMQTHRNLAVRYTHSLDPRYVDLTSNTVLGILPFFHGYGLTTNLISLILGQTAIVIKRFQEEVFLKAIQDYRMTSLWLAPPLVVLLAKSPLVDKYDLSCVKEIASGAAPLSKEVEESVTKRLNVKNIRQGYGLTEATLAVIMLECNQNRFGSSGKVVPFMKCKVRDPETGRSLGPHQVGELCFKGPMVMAGYYGNEEATRNSFTSDGWLLTGDLGYYDEEEYFYIVDRLKELIKYNGFQVAPAELEAVILNHPKVKDVGVVGIPDDVAGELPLAFVAKKDNVDLTEKEIVDFVAGKVSSQKRLRGGVIFVPTIPKNPSGKILRRELRKMLQGHKAKL